MQAYEAILVFDPWLKRAAAPPDRFVEAALSAMQADVPKSGASDAENTVVKHIRNIVRTGSHGGGVSVQVQLLALLTTAVQMSSAI